MDPKALVLLSIITVVHNAASKTTVLQVNETIDNILNTQQLHDGLETINNVDYNFGVYKKGEFGYEVMKELNKFVNHTAGNEAFAGLYFAEFRLFTRSNPSDYQVLNRQNIQISNFNASLDTMFIIHGWLQTAETPRVLNMKDAIHSMWDMNAVVVQWGELATKFYSVARFGIDDIATDVSSMMTFLNQDIGQSMDMMHAVGFSLGAHVAGLAGKRVGGRMANIVGVDPALPFFSIWNTNNRLNVGDAQYVQVIHNTGDTLGFMPPLGDYDVYPNGGKRQPGCPLEIIPMCSHGLSQVYFSNAVRDPAAYVSYQCYNFWQIALGYCTPVGVYAPLIQIKPTTKYYGVFWARV